MSPVKIAAAVLVVAAVAGGGGLYYVRHRAPTQTAERLLAEGKPREALIELRNVTRNRPQDSRGFALMADAHTQLGDAAAAERDLQRAFSLGGDRAVLQLRLGKLYLGQRRFQEIVSGIPVSGPDPDTTARFLALRSRAFLGLNNVAAATQAFEAARKLAPGNADVLLAASRLATVREDAPAAETAIDAALVADPADVEALLVKAQMLSAAGNPEGALAMADRAVAASPDLAAPRLARANLLLSRGDDEKAQRDVAAVLAGQPRNASAQYLAGVIAIRQGRFVEADQVLGGLGNTTSRFPRVTYFLALAALGRGLPATAVGFADRYAAQVPQDPDGTRLLARAQAANNRSDLAAKTLADGMARGMTDSRTLDQYGRALANTGQPAAATDAFRKALTEAPDDPAIQVHQAELEVQEGEGPAAVALLRKVDQAGPEQPGVLRALATAQISAGDLDAASATLDRLRAQAGETESVGLLKGMLAMARMEPEQAVEAFSAVSRAFPASMTAQLDTAKALVAAGRPEEARTRLAQLLAKEPANFAALQDFVRLAIDGNDFGAANRALRAAIAAAPGQDSLVAMQADVLIRAGNPSEALAAIAAAGSDARAKPILLAALARAQEAANQPGPASETLRALIAISPSTQSTLSLVRLQLAAHATVDAIATLDQAIERTKGDLALLTRRVTLATELSGPEAGLREAALLRQDAGQMPAARLLQGDALMRAGRAAEAVRAFRQERQADPSAPIGLRLAEAQIASGDDPGAIATLGDLPQSPDVSLLLAQIDIRSRRWADAARHTEDALRTRPNDAALLNNLAWSYQMIGDGRARATAQRSFLLDPTPSSADTLGWIMAQQGAARQAVAVLQQAAAARPDDPGIAYHLALALDQSGDSAAARQRLASALASPSPFDDRPAATALAAQIDGRK